MEVFTVCRLRWRPNGTAVPASVLIFERYNTSETAPEMSRTRNEQIKPGGWLAQDTRTKQQYEWASIKPGLFMHFNNEKKVVLWFHHFFLST
jgi:hypothetical protein